MKQSTLLLSHPLPRDAVELGRLVLEPKYPDHDFCPSLDGSGYTPDVATQRLENFEDILDRTRGTRLELNLLKVLNVALPLPERAESTTLSSRLCIGYQLRNSGDYFSALCREERVRNWLATRFRRSFGGVYLVCGFKTLVDARVEQKHGSKMDGKLSVAVPAALIAGAAGVPLPVPLDSGLDVGGSLAVNAKFDEKGSYTVVGEQVFAVQYRKIRCSWFSTQKVDTAYLESGNRWKLYGPLRGGDGGDEEDDGIDAELADPVASPDLPGTYEALDLDEERFICQVDEEVEDEGESSDDLD